MRTLFLMFACVSFGLPGASAHAQETPLQGVFASAGGGRETIDKAVEAATSKMNFVIRSVARSRLKKTNPPYQRIDIRNDGSQITVRFDKGNPVVMPADGAAVKWKRDDGEVFDVSAHAQGSQLRQTFKAEDGQRVNEFNMSADGVLTLNVTLTSPQLPQPVKYVLTYRRE